MAEDPVRHQYHSDQRAEVFDFLRASLPADASARVIKQWTWKYESCPFCPAEGPTVDLIRIGSKLVSMVAGCRFEDVDGRYRMHPIHFNHLTQEDRYDLLKFSSSRQWYLTIGDGELEMSD